MITGSYVPTAIAGNGATVSWAFPYPFFAPSDLLVTLNDASGNPVAITLGGTGTYDYGVTGTLDPEMGEYTEGGTVIFNTAPPANYTGKIDSGVVAIQPATLPNYGAFSAKAVEGVLDRFIVLAQQLKAAVTAGVGTVAAANVTGLTAAIEALLPGLATTSVAGLVKPDGTSITLGAGGLISSGGGGGGGSGTVTSVVAGTGLSGGTITGSGTISLPATGVTAGSYTNTNLTVDAEGRLTAASNGTGGGGGGLWSAILSTLPTIAGTGFSTWVNQGATATASDNAIGTSLVDWTGTGGENWRIRTKAAPGTPYTATALVAITAYTPSEAIGGIGFRDSATGKFQAIAIGFVSGAWQVAVFNYASPTSYSGQAASAEGNFSTLIWFRIADTGTTVSFGISTDGAVFETIYSVAKSAGYLGSSGYNQLMLGIDPFNGVGMNVLSWSGA